MAMTNKDDPKGPKPLTREDVERTANEIKDLHEERSMLEAELRERAQTRDVEIAEAKKVHAECRGKAEEYKSQMAAKLAERVAAHDLIRKQDADKIAAMVKQQNENSSKIRQLEAQLAALKAKAACA
jgi:hypothetical protein